MKMKRRAQKLSQIDVAKAVNISASFYGNIERGLRVPSIDTLVAIANTLGVGTDFLLESSLTASSVHHTPEEIRTLYRYLLDRIEEIQYEDTAEENDSDPPTHP